MLRMRINIRVIRYENGRKGIYAGKLYLLPFEGCHRIFAVHDSIWYGQTGAFMVLPASAALYSRDEIVLCCYLFVGL